MNLWDPVRRVARFGVKPGMQADLVRRLAFANALALVGFGGTAVGIAVSATLVGGLRDFYGVFAGLFFGLILILMKSGMIFAGRLLLNFQIYACAFLVIYLNPQLEGVGILITGFCYTVLLFSPREKWSFIAAMGMGVFMLALWFLIPVGYLGPGALGPGIDVDEVNTVLRAATIISFVPFYILFWTNENLIREMDREEERQKRSLRLTVFADITRSLGRNLKGISDRIDACIAALERGEVNQETLKRLGKECSAMAEIVRTLLTYSGQSQESVDAFDARDCLDRASLFLGSVMEERGAVLRVSDWKDEYRSIRGIRADLFESLLVLLLDLVERDAKGMDIRVAVTRLKNSGQSRCLIRLESEVRANAGKAPPVKELSSQGHRMEFVRLNLLRSNGKVTLIPRGFVLDLMAA